MPDRAQLDRHFPRLTAFDPAVPVWCCTPDTGRCIHRFFDTSPVSPDGRFLAVFRLPFEDRLGRPGETGEVVLIDLHEGGERVVATTAGWEPQMGCNLNWAGPDHLAFNDVDTATWTPMVVKLSIHTGQSQRWPGGVYQVSPCGRFAAAASMDKMRRTQPGYGVVVPDDRTVRNIGARDDDGLFITDLDTGHRKLVLSLAEARLSIPELKDLSEQELAAWEIYGFHSKWTPAGDRLIFTVRRYLHHGTAGFNAFERGKEGIKVRFDVLTCKPDGSDVYDAVPAPRWELGGHHINFFPDGTRLSANIRLDKDEYLSLIQVNYDGSDLRKITQRTPGSGHPTVHPNGRHILTDTYTHEPMAFGDGSVPLRWIDVVNDTETMLLRTGSRVEPKGKGVLRLDPHPAWDRTWKWFAFNGVDATNTRRVYLVDMSDRV